MAVLKAKDVEQTLCKKGFQREDNEHRRFRLFIDGMRKGVWTMTSHNGQDIDSHLQSCMARQMKLSKSEFLLFVTCTISKERYIEILKQREQL